MHIEDELKDQVQIFFERESQHMGHTLGIEFLSFKQDEVKGRMPVDARTCQPFGILHGGASVALAETLASIGAWLNIDFETKNAVGVEINANHIRPVKKGAEVIGSARPISRGSRIQVWETTIVTPEEKLVCVSRCTLAVVEKRD